MNTPEKPKPRAFDLPGKKPEKTAPPAKSPKPTALDIEDVSLSEEILDTFDAPPPPPASRKRGVGWLSLFLSSLGLMASLAIGLAIDQLIRDLFQRHEWLGWFGGGLTAILAVAAFMIILREILALLRLRRIDTLRTQAKAAYDKNNKVPAEQIERRVLALYAERADMAAARAALEAHKDDIIDGRGRITLIERQLLKSLDRRANRLVMEAAKRVAIVTAVSPRALIDLLYVLAENLRLIRALSDLYGGRPGMLGFIRLTRNVLSHLAFTGALSMGDGLVQQIIGHGIAGRLSARFGEGVVNGLLTARIGLAAHDLCRPIPFLGAKRPSISIYMNALLGLNGEKDLS